MDEKRAEELARVLRVDLTVVPPEWWRYGVQTELEALSLLLSTGAVTLTGTVPKDEVAARYAIEKLKRYPDWYQRLRKCEDGALRYWRQMDDPAQ